MKTAERVLFPFSAIVEQETMKLALVLNAIDPLIGGVLISGTRGTAKSTAVRALAQVLPHPTPFVDLPVGATEDRVLGTLNIEKALQHGEKHFEPGLLAEANGGILYIDEVNLLPDHLVDVILDTVAMGVNRVEREGISHTHEARIMLVGTMNPEEGELRPQLLDRFGLCASVEPFSNLHVRKLAMQRRLEFDRNPAMFVEKFEEEQRELAARIVDARALLPRVVVPESVLEQILEKTTEAGADGLRADLALHRASSALAAWHGREQATEEDVEAVAELALRHRRRRKEMQQQQPPPSRPPAPKPPAPNGTNGQQQPQNETSSKKEHLLGFGEAQLVPWSHRPVKRRLNNRRQSPSGKGRGTETVSASGVMRVSTKRTSSLALAETLRTAGPRNHGRLPLTPVALEDCRWRSRRQRRHKLVVFVVDASGSMAAAARMRTAKSVALTLLEKAYRQRSSVALVAFRNQTAEVLLRPTRSPFLAFQQLRQLPAGGATPLAAGLRVSRELVRLTLDRTPNLDPFLVLITDGRATGTTHGFSEALQVANEIGEQGLPSLCIDTETGPVRLGQTAHLARLMKADYVHTSELPPSQWAPIIEEWLSWQG